MKKFRVMYRQTDRSDDQLTARTEEVYADGWRVESDKVTLFQHDNTGDISVLDVPRTRIMRIQEMS